MHVKFTYIKTFYKKHVMERYIRVKISRREAVYDRIYWYELIVSDEYFIWKHLFDSVNNEVETGK